MLCRQLLRCARAWQPLLATSTTRSASILSALNSSPVLISSNNDIYTNLALEHWLYTNIRFNQDGDGKSNESVGIHFNHPILLIWTDEPSLVLGRHQNPWVEANLGLVNKLGIKVARRHSGGGCVYHDENNINISVIGERKLFENRQENLRFLANILDKKYGIKCEPNKRHDLIHSATGLKMSGSAAKLGRHNSYHHFTLLVDTDKEIMKAAIREKQQDFIKTNSSLSTRSSVINLNELKPGLTTNQVISDLAQAYGEHYCKGISEQPSRKSKTEGDEDDLASLTRIKQDLMDWNWIYGMTPRFKMERVVNLVDRGKDMSASFRVHVDKAVFKGFEIECDEPSISAYSDRFKHLVNTSFNYKDAMVNVVKMLQVDDNNLQSLTGYEQIFATHLLQMIHEANF
uniref:Lipoyltransferase 1, mitochondrial n=1 Tax=Aceria tosichella TaxID=561515 RepID=A0A6G1SDC8_9ACAR